MTVMHKQVAREEPSLARKGDLRRDHREAGSSPQGPDSQTVGKAAPLVEAHIAHALNLAIAQLQNAEELLVDADLDVTGQLTILHAITVRLQKRSRSLDDRT
jgi:hypothetical protein